MKPHVVVASAAHHGPAVLAEFLAGLRRLDAQGIELSFLIVDDTDDQRSGRLLARFAAPDGHAILTAGNVDAPALPDAGGSPEQLAGRSTASKDLLLAEARQRGATHVLLVDSGLLLPPPLVRHLVSLERDIVSEVFWSEWQMGATPMPSVWLSDEYSLFPPALARAGADQQAAAANAFIAKLHERGTYPVGGAGGCTLISRAVIDAGTSFKALPNVSFLGEERHFSIRAAALGFSLWADTHYPPLHLYREADLGMAGHFWARWLTKGTEAA